MREILFRAKRADNGEWIYGNLFIPDNPDKPVEILIGTNSVRISYEVIHETVGQYTGLTDKNGTKIFEGDICSFDDTDGELINYAVLWFGRKWVVREANSNAVDDLDLFFCQRSVVIGNIYDNPELMKGDNNN